MFYQAGRGFVEQAWVRASPQMIANIQEIDSVPLPGKIPSESCPLLSKYVACPEKHL